MNLYRKKGFTALFLVCSLAAPSLAFAQETSTSTLSSLTGTIIDGAVTTWSWGRSTVNILSLIGNEKVENLKVPVLGVQVSKLSDTWGDARSNGRTHEGIDILAPRNTPVISPTKAVVSEIGYGALGGNYVYTINPGGERFYYAHLDHYASGLTKGQVLEAGDLIGYVGNTGNAVDGPTHLHFGIYNGGASNPYPHLTLDWAANELSAINSKLGTTVQIPSTSTAKLAVNSISLYRNLTIGSHGEDVRALQKFLNTHGAVIATTGAGSPGNETTYFGQATRNALVIYQRSQHIDPASGYFGPLTRSNVSKELSSICNEVI